MKFSTTILLLIQSWLKHQAEVRKLPINVKNKNKMMTQPNPIINQANLKSKLLTLSIYSEILIIKQNKIRQFNEMYWLHKDLCSPAILSFTRPHMLGSKETWFKFSWNPCQGRWQERLGSRERVRGRANWSSSSPRLLACCSAWTGYWCQVCGHMGKGNTKTTKNRMGTVPPEFNSNFTIK